MIANIVIKFQISLESENKKDFIKQLKNLFKSEYNMELDEKEIKKIYDFNDK